MNKFKESKITEILNIIAVLLFILFIISLGIGVFYHIFLYGMFFIPIAALVLSISHSFSLKNEYTDEFIVYIKSRLKNTKTLQDLYSIEKEFMELAVENNSYNLSYPITLRKIHQEIINKIDILESIN